ncbi:MAG: bi-domain-containing oxidoreductase [Thermodesulfobacteriota bacterium]|nr:bi-domain-containing oxidoreductase [Thermodesulfobacteriota bacterium]
MKQILQNLKTGITEVVEVPCPALMRGQIMIRTTCSLISAGTERMLVDFGKASWINKARQQPDKVRMVLDKVRTDGFTPALDAVRNKLDQPLPLGYCNVGRVHEVGAGVRSFEVDDRVASNGKHAEMVSIPVNLCSKIPAGVSDDEAAFTVIGAIALQGIRLVQPTLGEMVVVTGLGLIGLVAVQLLRAHGCRVLGIDFDGNRLELARQFGAETVDLSRGEDSIGAAHLFSRGRGVDAVIITAATKSNEPMHQAAAMCRKRGRIVLVGVTGLQLHRDDFYEKELTFQVSCSYGPGRYDTHYEENGQDYPIGFVRWTEQRNFEAVLDMMKEGRLDVKPLISHRFIVEHATEAYDLVAENKSALGIMLEYPKFPGDVQEQERIHTRTIQLSPRTSERAGIPSVGFIGSGNYAMGVLIPAFKRAGVRLRTVASSTGVSGVHAGQKYDFEETTTDIERLLSDSEVDAVVIVTRHNSHAGFVIKALKAGKHVFVEKPLCLKPQELRDIIDAYNEIGNTTFKTKNCPVLMVGFNRRFAPQIQKMKTLLANVKGPKSFVITVNAGAIPTNHWIQDLEVGGGRILGEACHFVDLLRFLADSPIFSYSRSAMDSENGDTVSLQLRFSDGSIGTVHYFANGNKSFPKERIEVFASGRVLQLDNFRILHGFGWPKFRKMKLLKQDKGQRACAAAFIRAVQNGGPLPIPFHEICQSTEVTLNLASDH